MGGPTAANAVTINNGHAITTPAALVQAGSLVIATGATATSLTLGGNLNVTSAGGGTGNVTINASTANVTRSIVAGANTLAITGNVVVQGGNTAGGGSNISQLTATTGIITIGGTLTITAGAAVQNIARVTLTTGRITVGGDTTLTGGGAANRDALLSVTGASAPGNGVIIGGNLDISSTIAGSSTVSITASGGRITVNGATGVTNGDTLSVGQGILTVAADLSVTNSSIVTTTTLATPGQLNVNGNVTVTGGSLASSSASITGTTGAITIGGNATMTGGSINASTATLSVTTGTLSIGGNATVNAGTSNGSSASMTVTTGGITVGGNLDLTGGGAATSNATVSVSTGSIDVTGNATLQGFAANRTATLTASATPAGAFSIQIGGNLTIDSATASTATVQNSAGSGVIIVNGAGGVANGDRVLVNAGTFNVTNPAATFAQVNAGHVTTTTVTSGTLSIAGAATITGGSTASSGATMSVTTGNIAIGGNATVMGGSFNPSSSALTVTTGVLTVGGNLAVTAGSVATSNATVSVTTGRITVTGNATLDGFAANRTALLSVTGAPAVAGNGVNIDGALTINSATVNTGTAQITAAGGVINVNGAGGVNSGDRILVNAGAFSVTNPAATFVNSNAAVVAVTTVTTGSLDIAGNLANAAGETITISSTGSVTVGGTFASSGTFTNSAAGQLFLGGATSTFDGTFNRGTGTVTMNGSAAQTLTGTALNASPGGLYNLVITNASGVALGNSVRVNNVLTFTVGNIVTGANSVISLPSCVTASVARTSGHVHGNFQKTVPLGSPSCRFEVGTGAIYAPVDIAYASVSPAGSTIASTTAGEHPSIDDSTIPDTVDVSRYWTLTHQTMTAGTYDATFNFDPSDVDVGADTNAFIVQRFSPADPAAGAWFPTTTGTRTATSTQTTGLAIGDFGDFAIGIDSALVTTIGRFNAFEPTTDLSGDPLGQFGRIFTKVAGAAAPGGITVTMIAINGAKTAVQAGFSNTAGVELYDASNNTGAETNGCRANWVKIKDLPDATFVNGVATYNFAEAEAYPHARLRIRRGGGNRYGCSVDGFAIRPWKFDAFSATDTDAQTAGTGRVLNETSAFGSVTHKAGRPFTVRATAINSDGATTVNYAGTPNVAVSPCAGALCTGSTGTATVAAAFTAGALTDNTATYSEVGAFRMKLSDLSFAFIDSGGSEPDLREIASDDLDLGRFVPNHFTASLNAPSFTTGCAAGSFTYVGQIFNYGTAPVITVTARNFAGDPTALYAGTWWRLSNASLTGKTYTTATGSLDLGTLPSPDPVIAQSGSGVGTLTFASSSGPGTGIAFQRTTPVAPFNAEISLAINVIDADGVIYESPVGTNANPARFGAATPGNGIAFSSGKEMRFGRLRLGNASGSERIDLPVPLQAQYWTGTGFAVNSADGCTSLSAGNFSFSAYTGGITAGNMNAANISLSGAFSSGIGSLRLIKPTTPVPTTSGSATLTLNLSAEAKTYLRGNWGVPTFTADPAARVSFGSFSAQPRQFIFFRENY